MDAPKPLLTADALLLLEAALPNAPEDWPALPDKAPGLLLLLLLLALLASPGRPNKLLEVPMPAWMLLAAPDANPGCGRRAAAAAAAVGDPAALLPRLPPAQAYLEAAIKPAGMLLLLEATAWLLLLMLPAVAALGDPASTGRRIWASNVDPVGDCGPPEAPVLPPPGPVLLLLLPPTLAEAPGLGEPMLPLVADAARAAGRVRLLNPDAADATATAVRTDMPVLVGLLLLLLLLGPPLPNCLS